MPLTFRDDKFSALRWCGGGHFWYDVLARFATSTEPSLADHTIRKDFLGTFSLSHCKIPSAHLICQSQGLDWHGPSSDDVWCCLGALTAILSDKDIFRDWIIAPNARAILIGSSLTPPPTSSHTTTSTIRAFQRWTRDVVERCPIPRPSRRWQVVQILLACCCDIELILSSNSGGWIYKITSICPSNALSVSADRL